MELAKTHVKLMVLNKDGSLTTVCGANYRSTWWMTMTTDKTFQVMLSMGSVEVPERHWPKQ